MSIILKIMLRCNTQVLKKVVIKPSLLHCNFVDHTPKKHVVRGLRNNYHLYLEPKLGQVICEIWWIQCACVVCTEILNKQWYPGVLHTEHPQYKPILECTHRTALGSFNNRIIIKFNNKVHPVKTLM